MEGVSAFTRQVNSDTVILSHRRIVAYDVKEQNVNTKNVEEKKDDLGWQLMARQWSQWTNYCWVFFFFKK